LGLDDFRSLSFDGYGWRAISFDLPYPDRAESGFLLFAQVDCYDGIGVSSDKHQWIGMRRMRICRNPNKDKNGQAPLPPSISGAQSH
jgi:hypothetical protein